MSMRCGPSLVTAIASDGGVINARQFDTQLRLLVLLKHSAHILVWCQALRVCCSWDTALRRHAGRLSVFGDSSRASHQDVRGALARLRPPLAHAVHTRSLRSIPCRQARDFSRIASFEAVDTHFGDSALASLGRVATL